MPQLERFSTESYEIEKHSAEPDGNIHLDEFKVREVIRVAQDGFGPTMSEEEIKNVVIPNTILFIAHRNRITVGFEASSYSKHPEMNDLYLAAGAVVKSEWGHGLFTLLNRLAVQDGLDQGFRNITARTQNPTIEGAIIRSLDLLRGDSQISEYTIKREFLEAQYGRMLTKEIPLSKNESINQIYAKLNYKRGDAYFLTFSVKRS